MAIVVEIVESSKTLNVIQQTRVAGRPVFDVSISSGGKYISSFGNGLLTVSLPYTLKPLGRPERVKVYYLASDGSIQDMNASYRTRQTSQTFLWANGSAIR
ncbi:MAG: hypothetical protein LBT59_18315 [Clostridiales bacterium]|jgi:hypothetical protein|nr:hypothetical protein [Clostridiales bacterium]